MMRLALLVLLAGCSSLGAGQQLGATLTAVNYTDWPFDWVGVARVAEPEKAMAADRVTAFGASGQMCCVSLPAKWQPGMELVVQTQDGTRAKNSDEWDKEKIPTIKHRVAVPRYDSSDVGTVWVQLLPGGKVELVVSRFDPTHAQWPGKVKGWPQPTVEFRRKIWSEELARERKLLNTMQEALKRTDIPLEKRKKMEWVVADINQKIDMLERNKP